MTTGKEIGARLRMLRGKRNAGEIAARVGMSQSGLYSYEAGAVPGADVAYRLAQFYGTTVEYLVTGKELDSDLRAAVIMRHARERFDKGARAMIQEVEEILDEGDPGSRNDLAYALSMIRRARGTSKRRAGGRR